MQLWLVLSRSCSCIGVGNENYHIEKCMCMLKLRLWTVVCSGMNVVGSSEHLQRYDYS
jgi:hypothetical protein